MEVRAVQKDKGFPGGSVVENLPAKAEDVDTIPLSGSLPAEGNGNSLEYSCQT